MKTTGNEHKKEIVLLELFSGIGGFTKGFIDAGYTIKKHYFSEIDKHAIANYKYNFKDSIYVGSVTNVRGESIDRPDVITFGSPCQDFSLAGKREGLDGQRSSLILEAIRLITETKPSVFIWENVKGAFSSNDGADFWAIMQAFTNIGGYRLEWQLLNTRWFLPQNRERIYLVGHLAGASELGVFPIGENGQIFSKKSQSNKNRVQAQCSTTVTSRMGGRNTDTFIKVPKVANCLTGGGNSGGLHSDMTTIEVGTLRTYKDGQGFRKVQSNNVPTIPARARKDGSGQGVIKIRAVLTPNRTDKRQSGRRFKEDGEPSFTLNCQDRHGVMINDSIRRLTEIECERLQGFPDDWTKLGIYNDKVKPIPKTQRFKMLGNAVTTVVVKQIATKIKINDITI